MTNTTENNNIAKHLQSAHDEQGGIHAFMQAILCLADTRYISSYLVIDECDNVFMFVSAVLCCFNILDSALL